MLILYWTKIISKIYLKLYWYISDTLFSIVWFLTSNCTKRDDKKLEINISRMPFYSYLLIIIISEKSKDYREKDK